MARTEAFTTEQVIEAIHRGYTPTGAASVLGCHPETIRRYAAKYSTVRRALIEERKAIVDLAEIGLRGAVLAKEPWAIAFALKTLGKDEGYTERCEHTGANGGPIESSVTVHWPADEAPNE